MYMIIMLSIKFKKCFIFSL